MLMLCVPFEMPEIKGIIIETKTVPYGCGIAFTLDGGREICPSTYAWNWGWWKIIPMNPS